MLETAPRGSWHSLSGPLSHMVMAIIIIIIIIVAISIFHVLRSLQCFSSDFVLVGFQGPRTCFGLNLPRSLMSRIGLSFSCGLSNPTSTESRGPVSSHDLAARLQLMQAKGLADADHSSVFPARVVVGYFSPFNRPSSTLHL